MKNLELNDEHVALGAKMIPFAGFSMPVQYEGVNAEHHTVRNGVGVFDVSHMGEILLTGPKALDLIQYICSNDASKLEDGQIQYSCFPNDSGGIVDDLLVYRFTAEKFLLVVNASNIQKDWDWVQKQNQKFGVDLRNLSDDYCLFAVQGPKAVKALQALTEVDLSSIKYYTYKVGVFAGVDNIMISGTGYTGAGGFELYVPTAEAKKIWNSVMTSGEPFGIKPIGLAARDTLRLEMGYCLYGNDINDTTSPIEAGLSWITKFNKDFVNKLALSHQKANGTTKTLVGFELVDRGVARHDYKVVDNMGNQIGVVTSGTMSPTLKKAIGMAYVPVETSLVGAELLIQVRNKTLKAQVVKMPFIKK